MKIIMTSKYERTSKVANYPLAGYWYSIVEVIRTDFEQQYSSFYSGTIDRTQWLTSLMTPTFSYYPSISELRHARVLMDNGTCKISITLPSILQSKSIAMIFLYAIDGLEHPDYDYTEGGQVSSAEYVLNINNLSMVICNPPEGEFINRSTNIIDLKHLPKCSLITELSTTGIGVHDSHYMSSLLDRDNLASLRLSHANSFIESWSGVEASKDKQGTSAPNKLHGSMTMGTDRLVQL